MLYICRASAGSGKTQLLAATYLRCLLPDPGLAGQIQVLSFTNKATEEIKARILHQLAGLAADKGKEPPSWLGAACQTDDELSIQAHALLEKLTYEYDLFRVGTIDQFIHQLAGACCQSLGGDGSEELLLDASQFMRQSVRDWIEQAPALPGVDASLESMALSQLRQGRSWWIEKQLATWLDRLLMQPLPAAGERQAISAGQWSKWEKALRQWRRELAADAATALQKLTAAGYGASDLAWGEKGIFGTLTKLARQAPAPIGPRVYKAATDPHAWLAAAGRKDPALKQLVAEQLQPLLQSILGHLQEAQTYQTMACLLENRAMITLHLSLLDWLERCARKAGIKLPMPTARELVSFLNAPAGKQAVGGQETSIWLLDECQDMSGIQWGVLSPFVRHSLNQGGACWLVGDVKQSIYRWRGGDPFLLSRIGTEMGDAKLFYHDLQDNWRSDQLIVSLNNHVFPLLNRQLAAGCRQEAAPAGEDSEMAGQLPAMLRAASQTYAHTEQRIPAARQETLEEGHVELRLLPHSAGRSWREEALEQLIEKLEALQEAGTPLSDITILVRDGAEEQQVLQALSQRARATDRYSYAVWSRQGGLLEDHPFIRFLIGWLDYLATPTPPARLRLLFLYKSQVADRVAAHLQAWEEAHPNQLCHAWTEAGTPDIEGLASAPPYSLVCHLISRFGLDRVPSAAAYLLHFRDWIAKSADKVCALQELVCHWTATAHMVRLPAPRHQESMQLMTVHQAKGLAFPIVVIPFCDWSLHHPPHHAPVIWASAGQPPGGRSAASDSLQKSGAMPDPICRPGEGEHLTAPLLPLSYKKSLQDTLFMESFFRERWAHAWEQLNLLYVAFTRAKHGLYACLPDYTETGKQPTSVGQLLSGLLQPGTPLAAALPWQEKRLIPKGGSHTSPAPVAQAMPPATTASPAADVIRCLSLGKMQSRHPARLSDPSQEEEGMQALPDPGEGTTPLTTATGQNTGEKPPMSLYASSLPRVKKAASSYGDWWHRFLERLERLEDAPAVARHMCQHEGMPAWLASHIPDRVQSWGAHASLREWFSGAWQQLREHTLLHPDGRLLRPDRVIVRGQTAIVLDYKTGEPHSAHHSQVATYCHSLLAAGYQDVGGYLWYIDSSRLVTVRPLAETPASL